MPLQLLSSQFRAKSIAETAKRCSQGERYYLYGSLRSGGITPTDKKFTGQQDEGTAFGLYYYGAIQLRTGRQERRDRGNRASSQLRW
jgi:hypothetical protein